MDKEHSCEVIVGLFIWGAQACCQPATKKVFDQFGVSRYICDFHHSEFMK